MADTNKENETESSKAKWKLPWDKPNVLLWVILTAAALNVIFLGGKRRAFGVFVAELHVHFNRTSLAELNWIGDSYAALGYMTTTLSSAIILSCNRRYWLFQFIGSLFILLSCITSSVVPNPHWLFLTHTVLHGIGSSLVLSSVGLVVNEHFPPGHPYRILATTLVSGGSVASIIFVSLFAYIIFWHGWRLAFIILGFLYFVVNAGAAIFFKKNEDLEEVPNNKCSCDFKGHIRPKQIPLLILWFLDRVMVSLVTYGVLLNLTDYVRRTGNDIIVSSTLTILFASGEATTYLLGAIFTAITKDLLRKKFKYILLVTTLAMAILLVIWEFTTHNKIASHCFAYFTGFMMGPSITFLFPAGEELTTLPGHMAYPFSLAGMGVGMGLSPLVSAVIAEAFDYKWFFLVQGCIVFFKFLCLLLATLLISCYHLDDNGYHDLAKLDDNTKISDDDSTAASEMSERTPLELNVRKYE